MDSRALIDVCICFSGVTTNQSEGFHTIIKQLVMRKEKSPDSLALTLYYLQWIE